MLSRIADCLFWIGRYVERADGTARIVDALRLQLLEDPGAVEQAACTMVLRGIMGYGDVGDVDYVDTSRMLVFDARNPNAISGSWHAARENARRARETISTETWETINTTFHRWNSFTPGRATQYHLGWVRERAALLDGIADSTMSHDDAWDFLVLGRSLERADMTARLVATGATPAGPTWTSVLASCGAQQAMLRTMRGIITDRTAAAFLALDRQFPRSVLAALKEAEERLVVLAPDKDRVGFSDEARRILGHVRTQLEFSSPDAVLRDLPERMQEVQEAVMATSDAIAERYFRSGPLQEWTGEFV
ncbi:alpha-E domain-containing protein [Janibacter corallicola]|uniref:alpha-E domain-containing protein n=1 Tax=Janibacter corallicola TaxID=415212 RepID=UPI00082A1DE7|nr:alpha-E domain-containing protein [Janibacter corallicola]